MKNYEHIKKMENIMDEHDEKIKQLDEVVDYLLNHIDEFQELVDYYHSDRRQEDLKDDENGLIAEKLKRGVLSEDAIYDLISSYYSSCIKMLELSTKYFKQS